MGHQHPIHFTPGEAQAMLPEVIKLLTVIRDRKAELDKQGYDIRGHRFFTEMGTNGTKPYPDAVNELIASFRELVTKGVLVKDMDRGLIDFPAIRSNGEEVYLCYLLGESSIEYWHRIEDGFPGRQSMETF